MPHLGGLDHTPRGLDPPWDWEWQSLNSGTPKGAVWRPAPTEGSLAGGHPASPLFAVTLLHGGVGHGCAQGRHPQAGCTCICGAWSP